MESEKTKFQEEEMVPTLAIVTRAVLGFTSSEKAWPQRGRGG
jgi:hypothetical protein